MPKNSHSFGTTRKTAPPGAAKGIQSDRPAYVLGPSRLISQIFDDL